MLRDVIQLAYDENQKGLWVLSSDNVYYSDNQKADFRVVKLAESYMFKTARIAVLSVEKQAQKSRFLIAGNHCRIFGDDLYYIRCGAF